MAAIKGFYVHLFVFILVVAILAVVNLLTGGPWWVLGVFLIWGIAILAHGLAVMGRQWHFIANWEKRKIKQFMAEDR